MSNLTTETYSIEKLIEIEQILWRDQEKGNPGEFLVRFNGKHYLPRTSDISLLSDLPEKIEEEGGRQVEIRLYTGRSQYCRIFVLIVRDEPHAQVAPSLNGLELESRLQQAEQKWRFEALQGKYAGLEKERDELQDYTKELEDEVIRYRDKKFHLGDINLLDVGSGLLEGIIRRNPHILSKIPGVSTLAGAFAQDDSQEAPPKDQSEVHFEEVGDPEGMSTAIDELPDRDKEQLGVVVHYLTQRPDLIGVVLGLVEGEMGRGG